LGAISLKQGAGSREQGAGSREQGAGRLIIRVLKFSSPVNPLALKISLALLRQTNFMGMAYEGEIGLLAL
jgi:hypothetical protein